MIKTIGLSKVRALPLGDAVIQPLRRGIGHTNMGHNAFPVKPWKLDLLHLPLLG